MRDLEIWVPPDCVAACNEQEHRLALDEMKIMLKADLTPSEDIHFDSAATHHPDRAAPIKS
jgi:hypothetical protein